MEAARLFVASGTINCTEQTMGGGGGGGAGWGRRLGEVEWRCGVTSCR